MKKAIKPVLVLASLAILAGCENLDHYKAKEINRTVTVPLMFTRTFDATGVEKVTNSDGTVTRRAKSLSITTTAGGVTTTTVLKDAELSSDK